jgi:hypothetical protein
MILRPDTTAAATLGYPKRQYIAGHEAPRRGSGRHIGGALNGGKWSLVKQFVEVESGKGTDRTMLAEAIKACRLYGAKLVPIKGSLPGFIIARRAEPASSAPIATCRLGRWKLEQQTPLWEHTKGRQVSSDGGRAMVLSANISAIGDAAGAVLIIIIVENLPVPVDRRVWPEATALHQAGYTVSVICPTSRWTVCISTTIHGDL